MKYVQLLYFRNVSPKLMSILLILIGVQGEGYIPLPHPETLMS